MSQIKFIVSPVGEVKIEASGFVGETCQAATRPFIAALEDKPGEVQIQPTAEFYQAAEEHEHQTF